MKLKVTVKAVAEVKLEPSETNEFRTVKKRTPNTGSEFR